MPDQNARVKDLLMDTQFIVTNKFILFAADESIDQDRLNTLKQKADERITRFHAPRVWVRPVSLDADRVFSSMVAIEKINVPQLEELITALDGLIALLDTAFAGVEVSAPAAFDEKGAPGNFNLEAREALLDIRRKRLGRVRFFGNQGIDIVADPTYKTLIASQKPLLEECDAKLQSEAINANESNVFMLNGFAKAYQAAIETDVFLRHMEELNGYLTTLNVTA